MLLNAICRRAGCGLCMPLLEMIGQWLCLGLREVSDAGGGGVAGTPLLLGCSSTFSTFIMSCAILEHFFLLFVQQPSRYFSIVPGIEPTPDTLDVQ